MPTQLNNSVAKAFSILRLASEDRPQITAADLVRELGMNAITAHRFLKSLEREGALVQVSKGSYRLGYMLVDLGDRALQEGELGRTLQPVLDAMTADLSEASMATIYQAGMVVCIARAVSGRSLSVDVRVGHRLEAYCTAHGKLWLAHLPERERQRYLAETVLERKSSTTLTDRAALRMEIAAIARDGYARNRGEREEGIAAVAVPVLTETGRMVAGLSIFGPAQRMSEAVLATALARLRLGAQDAAARLYGRPV